MGIQVIPQQGNIFGRIGKGIGEGLSKQIPQEVDRYRLSQGLNQLGQQKNQTPFQQASQALQIPGITPEMVNTLIPLLQQQNAQQDFLRNQSQQQQTGVQNQAQAAPQPTQNIAQPRGAEKQELKTILTPESSALLQETVEPPSNDAINELAQNYLVTQPNRFRGDIDKARAQAESDLNRPFTKKLAEQQTALNQQGLKDKFDNDFDKYLSSVIQKEGMGKFSDIPGDMIQQSLAQAENDFASKKLSKEEAIRKYGNDLLDFAKSKQNLKTMGAKDWWDTSYKENLRALDNIRDQFKKHGRIEELQNLMESQLHLSPLNAAYLARPIKDNKQLNNWVAKQPKYKGSYHGGIVAPIDDKIIQDAVSNMNKEDSVLALSKAMQPKGYEPKEFLGAINEAYKKGLISLSDSQRRELEKPLPVFPSLDDAFYFSMLGYDQLVEQ